MSTAQAVLCFGTVRERLTILGLDAAEYITGIERPAAAGTVGGTIYDGICALKAQAETIYTWNLRHFEQCGPDVAPRIRIHWMQPSSECRTRYPLVPFATFVQDRG